MKKILGILCAFVCALFTFSACDLDMKDNYVFSYELTGKVADEKAQEALRELFKEMIDYEKPMSYNGPQYEAMQYIQEIYDKDVKAIDNDKVLALLGKEDYLYLYLVMTGTRSQSVLAQIYWHHVDEEDKPEGTGETSSLSE